MKKRFITLVLTLLCLLMFTGCSSAELSLLSALQKDAKMTSVKTTEVLSGKMNITLPEEVREEMDVNLQSILNMLSSFRLEATSQQQIKGNNANVKYNFAVISDDINFTSEMYVSTNMEQSQTIVKIPTPLKAFLPHKYENAIYCTIDTADAAEIAQKQLEYNRLRAEYFGEEYTETELPDVTPRVSMAEVLQLNDDIFSFLKNYATLMEDTPKLVTKSGNSYSLVITDKDFKDLLKSIVFTYFDKPQAREEIATLWDSIAAYCRAIYPDGMMENFPRLPELPQDPAMAQDIRLQTQLILALFDGVRIIGEDGIRVTYDTNSYGFITDMDVNIHLDFDINAITEILTGSADYDEDFAFEIRLQYNQQRQNINRTQTITFPTLTEENNLPFFRLITDEIQGDIDYYQSKLENGETFDSEFDDPEDDVILPASDGSISIVYDDGDWKEIIPLATETAPILNENGTLYVPLEPLMEFLGAEYSWNAETATIQFENPLTYHTMQYRPGDSVILGENYCITLSAPTMVKDGQDYLPLRTFISAFTDYNIRWGQEENAAYLIPWYCIAIDAE